MKTLLFVFFSFGALFAQNAIDFTYQLNVELVGLKSTTGSVRVYLMNEEGQFLKSCYAGKTFYFKAGKARQVTFTNLPPGDYAIMAYQDSNDDGKLNRDGMFGLPSEPYAFSNNPSTWFGPPAHRKCVFGLATEKVVRLEF